MSPFRKIARLVRLRFGLPFVHRADRSRDAGEWVEAVIGYRRGLDWLPWREDLKVQIGNCLKELGDYRGALRSYASVSGGLSLPEARNQAADAARRAGMLQPSFAIGEEPGNAKDNRARESLPFLSERLLPNRIRLDAAEPRGWLGTLGRDGHVSPRLRGAGYATVKFDQVGAMIVERDNAQEPLLAGVVAVRGRVWILGTLEHATLRVGAGADAVTFQVVLRPVTGQYSLRLHVFNVWIDAETLPRGRQWLSLDVGARLAPVGLFVNVAEPADGGLFASSNSFLAAPRHAPGELDQAVLAMPATVRGAARTLFDRPINSILAMRVDQLGDVSASLPALARLRASFPAARLTVLAQPGNQAIIEACGIADEVLPIALDYDPASERRRLDQAEEDRIRRILAPRRFDLAIDLSPGDESRPLLLLTGAAYLVGFNPDRFTFLDFGIAARSRDKVNQLEKLSHAATVAMLVETLAIAATPARETVPLPVAVGALETLALAPRRYVVLHTGARHPINRWPAARFAALCARLLAETTEDVVVFADPGTAALIARDERLRLFDTVEPALLDAILGGARAMVGNDSGPKHLAAMRGVPVISVHIDRLNWNEWGQDGVGAIVSKRVPCAGCGLNDLAMCGREAACLTTITVDEVFAALSRYL